MYIVKELDNGASSRSLDECTRDTITHATLMLMILTDLIAFWGRERESERERLRESETEKEKARAREIER